MRAIFSILFFLIFNSAPAQELFVFSEPASNMPQKSFALRANNFFMRDVSGRYMYNFSPEILFGLSAKWMLHAEAFSGNDPDRFKIDGASLYAKYRFYSEDEVHSHFRLAAYGKLAANGLPVTQQAIELGSRHAGAELGLVATKLIDRTAISAGGSLVAAFQNSAKPHIARRQALNYNLSIGTLLLPKEYLDYEQVNVNLMVELLGQTLIADGTSFVDLAPSIQFILLSKIRIDAGYRFPLLNDLPRANDRGALLRLEYNFFSAFK